MTKAPLRIKAPAKLNLRLRVTGRRADGYHLLSMWNVFIELCDEVELFPLEEGRVEVLCEAEGFATSLFSQSELELLNDPVENIAGKAATLLLDRYGLSARVSIKKRIPSGAGLGGGSSDAAAVLLLAKQMVLAMRGVEVPQTELSALGLGLGADVPFFLGSTAAIVEGIGENISPFYLGSIEGCECALVFPAVKCGTTEVYRTFRDQHSEGYNFDPDSLIKAIRTDQADFDWPKLVQNDLEAAAATLQPLLSEFRQELELLPDTIVGLTGSGSTLFVLPRTGVHFSALTKESIGQVADRLKGKHIFSHIIQRIGSRTPTQ